MLVSRLSVLKAGIILIQRMRSDCNRHCQAQLQLQGIGKRCEILKKVIDYLSTQPVVNYHQIGAITQKSKATNYKIIAELKTIGIIKSIDNAQRNQIWVFEGYLGLF